MFKKENDMKKMLAVLTLMLTLMFLAAVPAALADSRHGNSAWPSRLVNGTLSVRGPGYGPWGANWITVDSGVKSYQEAGTSKGPVIIYNKGNAWTVVQLQFNTGQKGRAQTLSQPISLVRAGEYGAIVKSGNACYDYSWDQFKAAPCK